MNLFKSSLAKQIGERLDSYQERAEKAEARCRKLEKIIKRFSEASHGCYHHILVEDGEVEDENNMGAS